MPAATTCWCSTATCPELHGDDVCRTVAAELPRTRVLMLTALGETEDLVEGLALGADDYLRKPFAFAELVARVIALARRAPRERPPVLEHGDVTLDPARHEVTRAGRPLDLTPKEFGVLETLLAAAGRHRQRRTSSCGGCGTRTSTRSPTRRA